MNAIHLSTETAIRKLVHDRAAAFRNKNISGVLETIRGRAEVAAWVANWLLPFRPRR